MRSRFLFLYANLLIVLLLASCAGIPDTTEILPPDIPQQELPEQEPTKDAPPTDSTAVAPAVPECAEDTTPPEEEPPQKEVETSRLTLTFAGDIMAHTPNFSMSDYSLIYKDIEDIIKGDDLTFANLETPVHAGRPYESYPTFNVQPPYVQAAIDAGFDVFSLANNHTNDQGAEGMRETRTYFEGKKPEGIYAAGIKAESGGGLTWQFIEKNGWKILFVAITELLNSHAHIDMIDYISPNATRRELLCRELEELRRENPCDIFVLSVHTCEDEYVHAITELRRNLYRSFIKSGVDIVWANHPHLAKEWEIFTRADTRSSSAEGDSTEDALQEEVEEASPHAIAMYALGNTISGQRTTPQFTKPETNRDYTGDGYLIQVEFEKTTGNSTDEGNIRITGITPHLITTYIDPERQYVIRRLNEDFIRSLRDEGRTSWADYLAARKKLMERIHGKHVTW